MKPRLRFHRLANLFNCQNAIALGVLVISGLAYGWLSSQSSANLFSPDGLRHAITESGSVGILIYISLIALAVVISPIPGAPITVAAGAVWGPILAGIYSVIGGFLGGLVAYFIGRSLGRSVVRALTGKLIYFSKDRGEVYLGWLIFVTRLLPVLSFDLVSYGAGLTGLSLPIYATATLLGMVPSTFLLTYMGSSLAVSLPSGILLAILFLLLLVILPWGIRRYNWLGLRDIIRIE